MSSPTIPQVRAWRPGELATAATAVRNAARTVEDQAVEVTSTMDELQATWSGDAAARGDERAADERRTGVALADALRAARTALSDGAVDVATARTNVLDKIAAAEERGFSVSDDGTVMPPAVPPVMSSPEGAADAAASRDREVERLNEEAQTIADGISRALTAAGEADAQVAGALQAVEFPASLESSVTAYLDRLLTTGDPVGALGSTAAGAVALANSLKGLVKSGTKAKNLADFLRYSTAPITDYDTFLKNMRAADSAMDALRTGPANGGLMRFVTGSKAARLAGKAFLPLTVLTGGIDVWTGGGYDGARGWVTRGAGAAGALGAGALMASGAGLVALGPVGLGIAGAAVVGYGLYSLGNLVYDNWDDIKEFGSNAADWVGDRAGDVADAAGDAADWAGDRLDDAADVGKSVLKTASFGLFG